MLQEWVDGMKLNLPQVLEVLKSQKIVSWIALDQSRSYWAELKWSDQKCSLQADVGLQILQKSKF